MNPRTVTRADRSEWLRMLLALHPESGPEDHVGAIDAFLGSLPHGELQPAVVFVVERDDGALCGFLELSIRNYAEDCTGDTPYVESWYVDEDVRGTGIGRLLVEAAEVWARERGYRELASDALLSNTVSHAAHAAVGFRETERIVTFRKELR